MDGGGRGIGRLIRVAEMVLLADERGMHLVHGSVYELEGAYSKSTPVSIYMHRATIPDHSDVSFLRSRQDCHLILLTFPPL